LPPVDLPPCALDLESESPLLPHEAAMAALIPN
jgi:hypothetical protein